MGIILMEYVQSDDLSNVPYEIYSAKFQEIESKALRTYVTALQCGVLQGDPKPQNFLLTEDDNVVLIDFGVARQLRHQEVVEFDGLLQKAEAGNCDELRLKLTKLESPDNKCLSKLIFRPRWDGPGTIKSGITKYPTLAPAIKLTKKVALEYKAGLSNPISTLPDRKRLSPEIIAELKRYAEHKKRRDMELHDRELRAEDEKYELELYYNELENPKKTKIQRTGGKRHTKYVGSRNRFGTRRKVQNRSF
jgi:serine/threonine protein kinase